MNKAGFTLIEMMVVITVIAIIAAIAMPSLLRSRIQANETAAIENLRAVHSAQTGFHTAYNRFADMAELTRPDPSQGMSFLDQTWQQGGIRQGYTFSLDAADAGWFLCYADPTQGGVTGVRYFRVDVSGVIRWNGAARPADNDPAIGEI